MGVAAPNQTQFAKMSLGPEATVGHHESLVLSQARSESSSIWGRTVESCYLGMVSDTSGFDTAWS